MSVTLWILLAVAIDAAFWGFIVRRLHALRQQDRLIIEAAHRRARYALVGPGHERIQTLEALIRDLRQHAKERGWRD